MLALHNMAMQRPIGNTTLHYNTWCKEKKSVENITLPIIRIGIENKIKFSTLTHFKQLLKK